MIDSLASSLTVINGLVKPLLLIADKEWSSRQEFVTLKHLAHERISRELQWNLECIWKLDSDPSLSYALLLRTFAFDELVLSGVPLDRLFCDLMRPEWLDTSPIIVVSLKNELNPSQRFLICLIARTAASG